ncbi:MAG: DNA repair protein RecN [Bacteroidetes bacterium MedPE-SWsnd-G2]|nr:MAG: DNA repair protein RecN [Bacteroidetes bacterium MedPE-SWsnd-G2]
MITSLSIQNFALIDELFVEFSDGLTIITGETGAGKSIILGGLSLILGKRADLSAIKDNSKKCVIEACFNISKLDLKELFETEDLDYEVDTIIRREILPSGKSRAFINDTPVNLSSLLAVSNRLLDIHSQHQTMQLTEDLFQFEVIDALANTKDELLTYQSYLRELKKCKSELKRLEAYKKDAIKEHDYNTFLLKELDDAALSNIDLKAIEEEYEALNNVELISEKLSEANSVINNEDVGVIEQLKSVRQQLDKIAGFHSCYNELLERVDSVLIELNDVQSDMELQFEQLVSDPEQLILVNSKLQQVHSLFQKHSTLEISELISIQETLQEKVHKTENLDEDLEAISKRIKGLEDKTDDSALKLHKKRTSILKELVDALEFNVSELGMVNSKFKIELNLGDDYFENGKDKLRFLFSANKGGKFNDLKKSASGGELSRIMLSIKAILAKYTQLPTIMFDEIDTGVSGEIAHKMGDIMKEMSNYMQVFAITHLPQIAAKGNAHFKVYKEDVNGVTQTNLVKLSEEKRVNEIAQMLGGENISTSALAHAKQLLN